MAAVEQLFSYGPDVRRVMYTTNAVESVNASFRKAVRRGCFPDEDAVMKLLYLRVKELYRQWGEGCRPGGMGPGPQPAAVRRGDQGQDREVPVRRLTRTS